MNGNMLLEHPQAGFVDMPGDPFMSEQLVAEQAGLLETDARFTPAFAYEVGHDAVAADVAIDARSVETDSFRIIPEAQVGQVAAETWKSFSPFNAENTAMYGTEQDRQAAMETIRGVAEQSRMTGKYFSSGHKRLGKQLAAGEITADEHDQAVGEIMAVLAVTKPEHLRRVGEVQRATIDRRVRAGVLPEGTAFKEVVSRETADGVELAGVDAVVARMAGANSKAELTANALELKKHYYSEENYVKAGLRAQAHERDANMRMAAAKEQEIALRRTLDLLEEDKNKEKANA
jgi:hypothetical protein